jgi:hypothetical protein
MITCPNCNYNEIEGTIFCSECGTQLAPSSARVTQSINGSSPTNILITPSDDLGLDIPPEANEESGPVVYLRLVDYHGKLIKLYGEKEFTLGRIVEGQAILPDIDLSEYDAFGKGVSRQHAILKILEKQVVISDMGSANGTRINGQKIMPQINYPLNHGDVLTLGKLRMQVIIKL